jgi:hypothetical protein
MSISMNMSMTRAPVSMYIARAQKDEPFCHQLERQLSIPLRSGQLSVWHRGKLMPGSMEAAVCAEKFQAARIILLLISADLLTDHFDEVTAAFERRAYGVSVIPVLLRPTALLGPPLAGITMLPREGSVVVRGSTREAAWVEVVTGVMQVVEECVQAVATPPALAPAGSSALIDTAPGSGPGERGTTPPPVNTILFLSASPTNADRLACEREVKAIRECLERAEHRDRFRLVEEWAVTPGDLVRHFVRYRPAIVHFSGHGARGGRLVLENERGEAAPVLPASLGKLFQARRGKGIRCVLLNACYAIDQAAALAEHVDCVLGIQGVVPDPTAIAFARGFYTTLAGGESVADAAALARVQADLQALPSPDVLQLLTRPGVLAEDIRLV